MPYLVFSSGLPFSQCFFDATMMLAEEPKNAITRSPTIGVA